MPGDVENAQARLNMAAGGRKAWWKGFLEWGDHKKHNADSTAYDLMIQNNQPEAAYLLTYQNLWRVMAEAAGIPADSVEGQVVSAMIAHEQAAIMEERARNFDLFSTPVSAAPTHFAKPESLPPPTFTGATPSLPSGPTNLLGTYDETKNEALVESGIPGISGVLGALKILGLGGGYKGPDAQQGQAKAEAKLKNIENVLNQAIADARKNVNGVNQHNMDQLTTALKDVQLQRFNLNAADAQSAVANAIQPHAVTLGSKQMTTAELIRANGILNGVYLMAPEDTQTSLDPVLQFRSTAPQTDAALAMITKMNTIETSKEVTVEGIDVAQVQSVTTQLQRWGSSSYSADASTSGRGYGYQFGVFGIGASGGGGSSHAAHSYAGNVNSGASANTHKGTATTKTYSKSRLQIEEKALINIPTSLVTPTPAFIDAIKRVVSLCPTGFQNVGRGVAGPAEKWYVGTGQGGAQGKGVEACYDAVMADSECSKDYFTYVPRGDKNCGCKRNSNETLKVGSEDKADYYKIGSDLRMICEDKDVIPQLFRQFGSHVCLRVSLGGVRILNAVYQSATSLSVSDMAETTSNALTQYDASASASQYHGSAYGWFGGGSWSGSSSSGSAQEHNANAASGGKKVSGSAQLNGHMDVLSTVSGGKSGASSEAWRESLEPERNSNWRILDRYVFNCFGIWDYVTDANLSMSMCEQWHKNFLASKGVCHAGFAHSGSGVAGPAEKWNVGGAKGKGVEECYDAVMADSECSKDYFTYVPRGDKNCGCKTSQEELKVRTEDNSEYYKIGSAMMTSCENKGSPGFVAPGWSEPNFCDGTLTTGEFISSLPRPTPAPAPPPPRLTGLTQYSQGWDQTTWYTVLCRGDETCIVDWAWRGRFSFWAYDHRVPGTKEYSHGAGPYFSHLQQGPIKDLPHWCRRNTFTFWAYPYKVDGSIQLAQGYKDEGLYTFLHKGSETELPGWVGRNRFSFWVYPFNRADTVTIDSVTNCQKGMGTVCDCDLGGGDAHYFTFPAESVSCLADACMTRWTWLVENEKKNYEDYLKACHERR